MPHQFKAEQACLFVRLFFWRITDLFLADSNSCSLSAKLGWGYEYGQVCAHITRAALRGMICNPYREDRFWLLLALWANLSFYLICSRDQNTRSEKNPKIRKRDLLWHGHTLFLYLSAEPTQALLGNATHVLSVPQPKAPRALRHHTWSRGWTGTPFPCEPAQNGNQPCRSCVLIPDVLQVQHMHFSRFHFRSSAGEAKSPTPWKEKQEHKAKLLVQINSGA